MSKEEKMDAFIALVVLLVAVFVGVCLGRLTA